LGATVQYYTLFESSFHGEHLPLIRYASYLEQLQSHKASKITMLKNTQNATYFLTIHASGRLLSICIRVQKAHVELMLITD